jgi:2',3'-cyclic-nucleotide 2'-phosphodiesterase (5'-nucleotidase family)
VSSSFSGASKADDIFNKLDYDIITIGNHELYSYAVAKKVHEQAKTMSVSRSPSSRN